MPSYVEPQMRDALANHVLEVHVDTPLLKAWYLRPAEGGRMMSTMIISSREGLVIMGDLCPMQNGVISGFGYGAEWFGKRLSEDYLCSKFLKQVFIPEQGAAEVSRRIVEARRDAYISKEAARDAFDDVREAVRWGTLTYEKAYDIYTDAGLSDFEDTGYDYDPSEAGWLCAIQQRFAELYQTHAASRAA